MLSVVSFMTDTLNTALHEQNYLVAWLVEWQRHRATKHFHFSVLSILACLISLHSITGAKNYIQACLCKAISAPHLVISRGDVPVGLLCQTRNCFLIPRLSTFWMDSGLKDLLETYWVRKEIAHGINWPQDSRVRWSLTS